ncbi:MAG: LON peptidase substrate-binding domain-containing protein [Thiogranum sp.]|nr:LON peptidase substrate-binding domain-containing protein [Thiogranum sp.]
MRDPEEITLFPLQTVLFPGGVLPLRIFEPRYLDMVSECLRAQRGFGICAIRSGAETGKAADCYATGTLARIQDFDRDENNLLSVVVQGERRFRIVARRLTHNQLLRADVSWLDEGADAALPVRHQPLAKLLAQLLRRAGKPYTDLPADYEHTAWVVARLTELLPFALSDKQRLLEMDAPLERLDALYRELLAEEFRGGS